MAEIKKVNDTQVVDYMARDYTSILQAMRELIPERLPNWKDYTSEADFGNVLLQLFAHMGDILSYYQDRIANESFLGTARTRQSIIHHLKLIGYRLATAAPASTILKLTVPPTYTGTITVKKGDAFATKSQKEKPSIRFEYIGEDFTVDCSTLPTNSLTHRKEISNEIPVEEGRLIEKEKLGVSSGRPNQQFTLAHKGLILRSLGIGSEANKDITLTTKLGDMEEPWTPQETLAFSRAGQQGAVQKDYVIEVDEDDRATIIFGDGDFGAIPPAGADIYATYRIGGGLKGNVLANTIQTIVDAPQLTAIGARVNNPGPATGGSERESIEHAVMHAPGVFRSLKRAVTAEDYEALALNYKGVGKVRAEAGNWNRVKLFVAPDGGGSVSDILRKNLLAYFEDKRPLTTILEIADVDYVRIYLTAKLAIERYYIQENVKEKVRKAVKDLLAFDNVDFKQTLYLSKFYEAIEAVDGVRYVTITEFCELRSGQTADQRGYTTQTGGREMVKPDGKIDLGMNEIPRIPDDADDDPNYAGGIYIMLVEEGAV
ncbi:MAG: Baseplate J-like protein [Syntrophorhabdus sp. PtaU1.Bin002]|nr:MAG: Baseplate J-like protein [Syntrophorhabdus sp. PtaU1.Bin002]